MLKEHHPAETGYSGFTLAELLVIIAIIGVLVAVSVPTFSVWLPNYQLKGAATDLYSSLQSVKMEAIRANGEYAAVFDPDNGSYQLVSGGADRDYGTAGDNVVTETVTLANYGAGTGYGNGDATDAIDATRGWDDWVTFDDVNDGANVVVFNARGMINSQTNGGGEVYLQNNNNRAYAVVVLATGVIRLRSWQGAGWQ